MTGSTLDAVDGLRHDLGKYISFEVRFAGPEADAETLRAALKSDLLTTRKSGEHTESAWALWARLRPASLASDPDVVAIDDALGALAQIDLEGPHGELRRAAELARAVTDATRRLSRRIHAEVDGG